MAVGGINNNNNLVTFLLELALESSFDNHQQEHPSFGSIMSPGDVVTEYTGVGVNESDVWIDYKMYSDMDTSIPYTNGSNLFEPSGNSSSNSSQYIMPWPARTAWITIFSLMLVVATVGNALVAWIVLGRPLCLLLIYAHFFIYINQVFQEY